MKLSDLPSDLRDRYIESEIAKNFAQAESIRLDNDNKRMQLETLKNVGDQAHVYTFYGPVTEDTVFKCMTTLDVWSRRDPGCEITVIFNSPGGNVDDGFALYDFLRDLSRRGHRITTKCYGIAASMGAVLMQAGDERIIGPNSHMMVHEVSAIFEHGAQMKTSEMEDYKKLTEKLEETAIDILVSRSKVSKPQLKRRWHKHDWLLNAQEAVELGFADRIEE